MDKKIILIVDDDRFFRELIKDSLNDCYHVIEATGGDEAIALAKSLRPDLVILDIEIPGRNGIELCRELKSSQQTRSIPVILLSSHTHKKVIVLGLQAGADDYLTKPIYPPEVLARVDAHLRSRRYYAELEHRDLLMLLELSDTISVIRNPLKILRMIVNKMAEVVDVDRCSIFSIDRNGDLIVKASSDDPEEMDLKLDLARYPEISRAFETRRAVVVDDIRTDPLMESVREHVFDLLYNAIIVVPIIKKESVIGSFFLRTASTFQGGVPDRILNLCHLIANISANALENATLFESMKSAQEFLAEIAIRDGLTKLFTHRHFYERLDEEFSRARRHKDPLSLIFFDIDDFKRLNDSYGHTSGDEVLRKIGRVIREVVRESDIPARYGGDEFAILLPNTTSDGAMEMARRLSSIIRQLQIDEINNEKITISTGLSTNSHSSHRDFNQLVRLADKAMYQAKTGGKDRILEVSDPVKLEA